MKKIEVVAAIIIDNNRIFATQRGYGDFKDGWEFPGGKMEPGETPEAALVRESRRSLTLPFLSINFSRLSNMTIPNFI